MLWKPGPGGSRVGLVFVNAKVSSAAVQLRPFILPVVGQNRTVDTSHARQQLVTLFFTGKPHTSLKMSHPFSLRANFAASCSKTCVPGHFCSSK